MLAKHDSILPMKNKIIIKVASYLNRSSKTFGTSGGIQKFLFSNAMYQEPAIYILVKFLV